MPRSGSCLILEAKQQTYPCHIAGFNHFGAVEAAFARFASACQKVAFPSFGELDLSSARDAEAFFGTRMCFHFRHNLSFFNGRQRYGFCFGFPNISPKNVIFLLIFLFLALLLVFKAVCRLYNGLYRRGCGVGAGILYVSLGNNRVRARLFYGLSTPLMHRAYVGLAAKGGVVARTKGVGKGKQEALPNRCYGYRQGGLFG